MAGLPPLLQTHDLIGWAGPLTTSVTDAEVLAGESSDSATQPCPHGTGNQFLYGCGGQTSTGGTLQKCISPPGLNVRNTLGAAAALTVSGIVAGQIIVSVTQPERGADWAAKM